MMELTDRESVIYIREQYSPTGIRAMFFESLWVTSCDSASYRNE